MIDTNFHHSNTPVCQMCKFYHIEMSITGKVAEFCGLHNKEVKHYCTCEKWARN